MVDTTSNTAINISIHAPRAGSDNFTWLCVNPIINFNPRSPCGERQMTSARTKCANLISIHAPRAGSDGNFSSAFKSSILFQSTLPVRGATPMSQKAFKSPAISIHAPRAGSDLCKSMCSSASHQRIILSSGKYAFLQPKCSILL